MALSSIDLFTGIGGITHALKGIAHPLLYCDIDQDCHTVLKRLMAKHKLPSAPISDDVKTLGKRWMSEHGLRGRKPDMICGGFPCTSLSMLGLKDGFNNTIDGSGLFYEILRLADELSVPLLFLENVENILNMEMGTVAKELVHNRGYSIRWCINSAKNMGAPHQRHRWFCLAFKDSWVKKNPAAVARLMERYMPFNWDERREPERTVCGLAKPALKKVNRRHAMLGNSVVPDAVRYAFMYLWSGMRPPAYTAAAGHVISLRDAASEPQQTKAMMATKAKWPKCGRIDASHPTLLHVHKFEKPVIKPGHRYKHAITLDPKLFKPKVPPGGNLKLEVLNAPVAMRSWSTLRRGCTRASNYITRRTMRDLPTQVRYEVKTKNRDCPVNPHWTEFLMGYPKDWTAY